LEVVDYQPADDSYVVASGWGPRAQWYLNVVSHPEVGIEVGRRAAQVTAVALSADEGAEVFVRYAERHRYVARFVLPRLLGMAVDGSTEDFRAVGRRMPFVRFVPRR
jgi:deazaflavin-dependent oxidoreductase (nitroreductase family)